LNAYKLLIVDDEPVEREGLKAMLAKGFPGAEIRLAKNGREGVETALAYVPDVVLMDVKMPGMNGIEAVEAIAKELPVTKFVMVSAYDTFEYARQAMRLGVKDYLLKPSKAADIVATVGGVLRQLEDERRSALERERERSALRQMLPVVEADVVTQLLFDHVHDVHLDDLLALLGVKATTEAFVLLLTVQAPPGATESFYGKVKTKIRTLEIGWVGAMSGRHVPVVVFLEQGRTFRSQAGSVVQQLLTLARGTKDVDAFLGIGNPYGSLDQLRLSYQEALIASADADVPAKHRFYEDVRPNEAAADRAAEERAFDKRLVELARTGEWSAIRDAAEELIRGCETRGVSLVQAQQRVLEAVWICSRVLDDLGVSAERPRFSLQAQDYRQLRAETAGLLDKLAAAWDAYRGRHEPDVVQRIKAYILERSHEDISLETIAKRVGLSPFYISKLFKDQLGVNYIDFLTECRIERAKSLMADPDKSLKEIAFDVGYSDPNYFSKVFKKSCGVAPTEYRKAILG